MAKNVLGDIKDLFLGIVGPMGAATLAGAIDANIKGWVDSGSGDPKIRAILSSIESPSASLGALILSIYYLSVDTKTKKDLLPYLIALSANESYDTGNKIAQYVGLLKK